MLVIGDSYWVQLTLQDSLGGENQGEPFQKLPRTLRDSNSGRCGHVLELCRLCWGVCWVFLQWPQSISCAILIPLAWLDFPLWHCELCDDVLWLCVGWQRTEANSCLHCLSDNSLFVDVCGLELVVSAQIF